MRKKDRNRVANALAIAAGLGAMAYLGAEELRRHRERWQAPEVQSSIQRRQRERAEDVNRRALFDERSAGIAAAIARKQLVALRREARRTRRMLRGQPRLFGKRVLPGFGKLRSRIWGWVVIMKTVALTCEIGNDTMMRPRSFVGRLNGRFAPLSGADILPPADFARYVVAIKADVRIAPDVLVPYLRESLAPMTDEIIEFAEDHLHGLDEASRRRGRLSDPTRVRTTLAEMAELTVRVSSELVFLAQLSQNAADSARADELAILISQSAAVAGKRVDALPPKSR